MELNELRPFNSKNIAFDEFFNPGKSMFIEASAGTGKTYTIQQIVARMVADGTELRNILIVTYTEKAAGELKDRIRKKLEEVLETGKINKDFDKNARDAEHLNADLNDIDSSARPNARIYFENALRDVDSAPIFTIHSFCQKALKDYAYEAGRPFDMGMIGDECVIEKIAEWLRFKWLGKVDGKESLFVEILKESEGAAKLLEGGKKDGIIYKLASAISKYKGVNVDGSEIVECESVEPLKFGDEEIDEEKTHKILDILNDSSKVPFDAILEIDGVKRNFDTLEKNSTASFTCIPKKNPKNVIVVEFIEAIKNWDGKGTLFNGNSYGKIENVRFENSVIEDAISFFYKQKDSFKNIQSVIEEQLADIKLQKFLYSQIPELFEEWQKYKAENKLQSFDDMILAVRKKVIEKGIGNTDSTLCQKLREEFKFAIIDEFQDTNQLQWDIFGTLFLHKASDANKCGNAIIVVGDPKQSIYSFQGADVNVYQKAIREIGNGYKLECNFRSTANMIDACNALFDSSDQNTFFRRNAGKGVPESGKEGGEIRFMNSKVGAPKQSPRLYNETTGNWEETQPFWLTADDIKATDFAKFATQKIVDWCTFVDTKDENGKPVKWTKLRIFDKENPNKLRNVSFRDFAVLARSRSEMDPIEDEMKKSGVPFVRYKDDKLFVGHECAQWIAILRAIDAPDFSSYNRKILNEALATDFFRIPLGDAENERFDNPLCSERRQIAEWKKLADKRRFAEMQERIYADTKVVENRLKDLTQLQSRAKFLQIGNFAINSLYTSGCSLDEIIRILENLSRRAAAASEDDKDGTLIGKVTDTETVQVMTIHASKGLEFPVVISAAGWKGHFKGASGPFLYHDSENRLNVGLSEVAKETRTAEELEEWKRLFYVDFTRASSILMLPQYENWKKKAKDDAKSDAARKSTSAMDNAAKDDAANAAKNASTPVPEYEFLVNSFKKFRENTDNIKFIHDLEETSFNKKLADIINDDILPFLKESREDGSESEQRAQMAKLESAMPGHCIMQHSYSSLSGKQESAVQTEDGDAIDKNEDDFDDLTTEQQRLRKLEKKISIDKEPCRIQPAAFDANGNGYDEAGIRFPKGSKLGNAIHSIFEGLKFLEFGKLENAEEALEHPEFTDDVEKQFKLQALPISKHPEWESHTAEIVFNTMHAWLPVIHGSAAVAGKFFSLCELADPDHMAEVRFHFTKDGEAVAAAGYLQTICKGSIDLLFVRRENGETRYSILDWKTDLIADGLYDNESIRKKVDEHYSVQRVLYSYLLIKWLKTFCTKSATSDAAKTSDAESAAVKMSDAESAAKLDSARDRNCAVPMDEAEIFEKYFGGIYYAFVRGCKAGAGNGIYAQTWRDWAHLEAEYENVKKLMNKSQRKDGEND